MRGSVPPILEARLSPGEHLIEVGHAAPSSSRTIVVRARKTSLISFDIAGW
jgi:hypothetical protein